jgi:hypothetical protein
VPTAQAQHTIPGGFWDRVGFVYRDDCSRARLSLLQQTLLAPPTPGDLGRWLLSMAACASGAHVPPVRSAPGPQILTSEARQPIWGSLGSLRQRPSLPGGISANLLQ